jgi:hypothetical protein
MIYSDNQGVLSSAKGPTNYARTNHIDLRYHFTRDCIDNGILAVDYTPREDNPADIFTKALSPTKHSRFLDLLGIQTN